jgi:signal transduction histidine kinase
LNIKNKIKEYFSILKEKRKSLNIKTLIYLILFSLGIIFFLWIFQVVFLQVSYERYQIKEMKSMVSKIEATSLNDLDKTLLNLAYENSVCIEYENMYGNVIKYNTMLTGCGLDKNINNITTIKEELKSQSTSKSGVKLTNPVSHTKAYLYAIKNDNGYIFIYSTLEDIDSTSIVLKGQLIYIMILVLLFAFLVAYFLSKKITKPIEGITKKVREMSKGNYDVVFQENGTLEIDELAKTLNKTCKDMARIEELRRDLLANVSHDLKTPLTMIKAYAEMVRDITYNDSEKREKDLNIIIDEADRLTILVNDLLELSKMQAASADKLNIEEYDLVKEIKNILTKYDIIKETENYNFILELPEKAMVKAEKNKMNQVIYNLVNNAINYTGNDKKVTIRVVENKNNYLVEIIDTGKGIKNDDLPYIWDKYYKNDKNHQRNVVGTGIGLSIVRNILEQHKFKYGVNSKKNKGTTFYFEIDK